MHAYMDAFSLGTSVIHIGLDDHARFGLNAAPDHETPPFLSSSHIACLLGLKAEILGYVSK